MLRVLLAAIAAVLLVAPATAQEKVKLRYGQIANSARSVSSLALNIAQRKGFLAKENIELEVVGLRGV
jgi:ABC-type nitrate/sulfonate/bicarbonate transport system substrate-binding protein